MKRIFSVFVLIPVSFLGFAFSTETLTGYAVRQQKTEISEALPDLLEPVIQNKLPLHPEIAPETEKLLAQYKNRFSREAINRTLNAAQPYIGYIREKINEANLPQELFYIAFIESEFKPRAVSRSGAYGIWQFMRNSIGG